MMGSALDIDTSCQYQSISAFCMSVCAYTTLTDLQKYESLASSQEKHFFAAFVPNYAFKKVHKKVVSGEGQL
jgi:hypothetical protein